MKNKFHLDTMIYCVADNSAQLLQFTKEADLCNYYHDIYEGIETSAILVFDISIVDKRLQLGLADNDHCICDLPDFVLKSIESAILKG